MIFNPGKNVKTRHYSLNRKSKLDIFQAFETKALFLFLCRPVSVWVQQSLTPRLGFGSSFWHGQADEARQAGHAETDSPDNRHADKAI